ncbi:hypothetical protein D3C84_1032580 [compost metagenome]
MKRETHTLSEERHWIYAVDDDDLRHVVKLHQQITQLLQFGLAAIDTDVVDDQHTEMLRLTGITHWIPRIPHERMPQRVRTPTMLSRDLRVNGLAHDVGCQHLGSGV